jgi:ADP-ribose pyrophosphatase
VIRRRRKRYNALRKQWPDLFRNPPDAAYTILFERPEIKVAEASEKRRLSSKGLPRSWRRTGVVHENQYLVLIRDPVRFPDGKLGTYIRTMPSSGSAGAAILPILDGKVVLLRNFRHATRCFHLEIPRGFGDPGVSPSAQALQELREEIDATADTLISLGKLHSNTGMTADCVELFVAEILKFGHPQTSEGIIGIEVYNPAEVAELIRRGEITDSFTIAAFTRAWLASILPGLSNPLDGS